MRKKILFWIDAGLKELGIAKYINQKNNFDLFAIYDINYPLSDSFKNQKIANFKKEWFFWEGIENYSSKPDLSYLKSFETKYDINLWELVYSERIFSSPFHQYTSNEIYSILERECKFFESVLNDVKPDYLIIKITDFHRNHLLYLLCEKLNIKILSLIPSRVGYRAYVGSKINEFENSIENISILETKNTDEFNIENYLSSHNRLEQTKKIISSGTNLSFIKKIKSSLNLLFKINYNFTKSYDRLGITPIKLFFTYFRFFFKSKSRKLFIEKNFVKTFDDEHIIFFPLQVQPERNIDLESPYFFDQINLISNIAKCLPINYVLYVKEHFDMHKRNWRSISEYKKIMKLPNVKLIHPSISPKDLIGKSDLVITISSTAGMEAAYYNKPSLVFANTIYSTLPSVIQVRNFDNLYYTIKTALNTKANPKDLEIFLKNLDIHTFEFDAFKITSTAMKNFHNSGFLISSKISHYQMENFFSKYKNDYQNLAIKFLDTINNYEQKSKK